MRTSFPTLAISRTALLATSLGLAVAAHAAETVIAKLDNADNLNLGSSWLGGVTPGSSDVASWDAAVTAENTTLLGGDLSWAGIRVSNPGGPVTINAGNTLGSLGIDMSVATQNLVLAQPIVLNAAQTWNVAGGTSLTTSGALTGTPLTLTKTGLGTATLSSNGNTFAAAVTVSQGTLALNHALAMGAVTNAVTLGDANSGANPAEFKVDSGIAGTLNLPSISSSNFGSAQTITINGGSSLGANAAGLATTLSLAGSVPVTLKATQTGTSHSTAQDVNWRIQGSGIPAGTTALILDGTSKSLRTSQLSNTSDASDFTGDVLIKGTVATQNRTYLAQTAVNQNLGFVKNDITVGDGVASTTWTLVWGGETIGALNGPGNITLNNQNALNSIGLTIGNNNRNGVHNGNIGGGFGIAKVGTGTQELNGASTYSGTTTLTNGTLRLKRANAATWSNSNVAVSTDTANTPTLQLNAAVAGDTWTFAKQITGGSTTAKIEKVGPGAVVLSPAASSSFVGTASGALTVTEGKLVLNSTGFTTAPVVSVAGGASFAGTAAAGAVTASAGGIVQGGYNGTGTLTAGSLTFNGAGTIAGALSSSVTPLVVSGALTTSGGASSISVSLTGGVPANGTYHLVQFGSYGGSIGNFKFASPVRAMSLQQNGNFIDVAINSSNYPIWTGGGSGNWSSNGGSGNWKLSSDSSGTDFLALDNTLFDDGVGAGNTAITVGLTDISPGIITFNNSSKDYTLTQANGKDILTGSLVKTGSGKLTISGSFSFPGGSTLSGGTVSIANETALGTGNRTLNGGTLEYTGASATWSRATTVNAPGGTIAVTDPAAVLTHAGSLSGSGTLTKAGVGTLALSLASGTVDMPFTIAGGTLNLNYGGNAVTCTGNITGSTGVLRLDGTGASATTGLTLTGTNTFSGDTQIYGRRIFLNSPTANGGMGGNVVVKAGNWAFHGLTIMTDEQIADSAVLRFENTDNAYDVRLNGHTETLAGIESLESGQGTNNTFCIIENAGYDGGNDANGMADGTLILNGSGDHTYFGQLRDQNNPSGTNKLNLVKTGAGTQILQGPGISYSGTTQIGGTSLLVLDSASSFKSSAVTVGNGATLQLLGSTTMSGSPALNVSAGGSLKVDVDGTGTYTVPIAQTLAGSGTIAGGLSVSGTLSPGDTIGTLTCTGYCDLSFDSHITWQVGSSWASPTADSIHCQGFGVFSDSVSPAVITISPEGLTGFTETAKTFTLVQGTEPGQGFDASAFRIDASAFVAATGSYGSWGIQQNGNKLELVYTPGTATPFNVWAAALIANPADRAALGDPDHDGLPNVLEFILDGNPVNPAITNLPTVSASGTNLVFTYTRRDDAEYLNPSVEFDADLADVWTTAVSGSNCSIVVTENGANPDTVTVTIPKQTNVKLFARLKVNP
ncbi:autotransporter-associated beta strand repeat-containing protein [Haloferula sp. BvORR071]|uniref:beta strand repeat-containing protein n=1 Tax=Haloferula sp. BvORR071 TaxID=1396141 RepID=UPI002241012F|nr:autotransporter-associated beta strand repeat-containing protein [Haloferula sp. BvORR071]